MSRSRRVAWKSVVLPPPLSQGRRSLRSFYLRANAVGGPREPVRPVLLTHGRRLVDAVPPAEDVLDRQQQQIRPGRKERFKERVAHTRRVRRGVEVDPAEPIPQLRDSGE